MQTPSVELQTRPALESQLFEVHDWLKVKVVVVVVVVGVVVVTLIGVKTPGEQRKDNFQIK